MENHYRSSSSHSESGDEQRKETEFWRPWVDTDENLENLKPKSSKALHSCPYPTCRGHAGFKRKGEFMRHFHTQHENNPEECEHCGKIFTRKDNLTRHVKSSHEKEKPECIYCRKPLSRKDAVNRHQASCSENPKRSKIEPEVQLKQKTNHQRMDFD